ncbi:hypothetical protein H5V45_17015 [Nocardioides sp. KIGAM211]|uniref:Secreted protein n=1 Tax=Nocardioides luti TaxID=2761101 RepID=A0A7X0RKR0_9ACTN|nr:hypothetical protein [Nocardioides luti]MBB6629030.1 hypothetical protein [Nocardioides luti]
MRALIRTTISAAALVTALAGGLTACGDDAGTAADPGASSTAASPSATTSDEPSDEPSDDPGESSSSATSEPAPDGPACDDVWKAGERLARGYQGCVQDGEFVKRDLLGCSSGQRLSRYADHFWAAVGGEIHETESVLDKDRGYRDAVARCRG